MYCYNIQDNLVIERSFKKKCESDEDLRKLVKQTIPNSRVFTYNMNEYADTFTACKELTPLAEEAETHNWFVSVGNKSILALALLHVISSTGRWDVLQEETLFKSWMKDIVR